MTLTTRPDPPHGLRDADAVDELFVRFFRRDLLNFYPPEPARARGERPRAGEPEGGPTFRLIDGDPEADAACRIELFGVGYRLTPRDGARFSPHDRRMIRAIGAVLSLRHHHLFQVPHAARLELFRGGSEDHYVAAFVEPGVYALPAGPAQPDRLDDPDACAPPRSPPTRTAGSPPVHCSSGRATTRSGPRPAPVDALPYGVELTEPQEHPPAL